MTFDEIIARLRNIKASNQWITVGCTDEEYRHLYEAGIQGEGSILELGGGDGACTELFLASGRPVTQVDFKGEDSFRLVSDTTGLTKFQGTTKEFFEQNNKGFSLIFVDADHTHEGALHDISNSMKILEPNGILFAHDVCVPDTMHIGDICKGQAMEHAKTYTLVCATQPGLGKIQ